MVKKNIQRIFAVLLILSLCMVMIPSVAAQQTQTVSVNGLLVYAQPDPASQLLAVMSLGSTVTIFPNETQNGFTRVTLPDGRQGYAQLSVAGAPTSSGSSSSGAGGTSSVVVVSRGNIRVRETPSPSGIRIGFIPWGEEAFLLARDTTGDWYQINYQGLVGWVVADWFRIVSGSSSAISVSEPTSPTTETVTTANTSSTTVSTANVNISTAAPAGSTVQTLGNIRLRNAPSLNGERIGFVPWGAIASLIGYDTTGEWIQVDYQGVIGWTAAEWWTVGVDIPVTQPAASTSSTGTTSTTTAAAPGTENLTTTVVVSSPTGVVVKALGNLRLRTEPSLNGSQVASIAWGDQAAALALSADGEWLLLDYKGVQGWASSAWFEVLSGAISNLPIQ